MSRCENSGTYPRRLSEETSHAHTTSANSAFRRADGRVRGGDAHDSSRANYFSPERGSSRCRRTAHDYGRPGEGGSGISRERFEAGGDHPPPSEGIKASRRRGDPTSRGAADAYHEWLRVMVKELTPQLDRQFPSELEGVWIQVVDQTRYDEKCAAAKQVVDSNAHRLMKQPGIESIGVGGDPYDAMDIWIVIGVDKITPPVEQETPAEMGGFPVHLLETGGPAHLL